VVSDTKSCGGSDHGSDGIPGDEGGCSDDDGGCSHDDGGDTHDGGACSGGHSEPGGPGGSGSHPNGGDCRTGQVVIGWAFDSGRRGVDGDRISWKWFYPDAPKVLQIRSAIDAEEEILWPCNLCEKEITGGNLKLITR
jgi:hypothetical protein